MKTKKRCGIFAREGWSSYAVYHNGIHVLETVYLSRAVKLFESLQGTNHRDAIIEKNKRETK